MPKSKLVLFKSSSQNVIIYLDPSKKGNEICICKFNDRQKTVFVSRAPLTGANRISRDPVVCEDHFKTRNYNEISLPRSKDKQQDDQISEASGSKDVSNMDLIEHDRMSAHLVNENMLNKERTHYFETSDLDEIYPLTSLEKFRTSSLQVADSLSILKEADEASVSYNLSRLSRDLESSGEVTPIIKSSLDNRKEKKPLKAKFTSDAIISSTSSASLYYGGRNVNSVIVDDNFIKQFITIIESKSFTSRKEQLDELLRNISALYVDNGKSNKPKKKAGCWPILKKKKETKRAIAKSYPPLPVKKAKASVPYFNHSFYHYRLKSRLDGLTFAPHRNYNYGEKGSGFQSKGEPQDFYQLREQCLQNGTLFEDQEFPPTDSSLFFSHRPDRHFEWKRPGEIVSNPQLFVEGFSRFDVQQGELGDCWLLAAVANLTLYRRLFFQIVPDDQGFDEDYAGIFHFRFWQYGRWIDVVIDDRLPTYRGELVFLHSTEANEFWSALLEKAYAKLHGSYEALKGGSTCEAMEDFTGGVTEMYEMNASPPNLFKIIVKAYERWSLMGCSIEPDPDVLEAQTPEGLIRGHAYSITKVQYVNIRTPNVSGKIPLLRLRNPWGNESEWNGAWGDHAPEWQYISDAQKEELGLNFDADGEFWMSFKDFQTHFHRLEICNLNPDSLSEDELTEGRNKKWVMSVFEGEWVRGVTAGGCRNFLDTFWHNPQYRVTLDEADEEDEEDKCTMIVALMQKNRRQLRSTGGIDLLTIGFAIYHLPYPDRVPKPLNLDFFKYNASVARSPSFINLREVSCRFKLPRGTYCIVPSTFDPNDEGEFLLRVFSEHQNNMEENDQEVGLRDIDHKAPRGSGYIRRRFVRAVFLSRMQMGDEKPTFSLKKILDSMKLTPDDIKENDLIMELFKKIVGKDNEVDWKELQEILNYYTRKELFSEDEPSLRAQNVDGVGAVRGQGQEQQSSNENNLLTAILALLCGVLCKNTPLADAIPAPTQELPLNDAYYAETKNKGFSKDVCRSMIAMMDTDRTGKLNFEEFKRLWTNIRIWKEVFKKYDTNNSGTLTGFELRNALSSAGYTLNNRTLNILGHRYGNKLGEIEFDDFLMCAVKLKIMIELFKEATKNGLDTATFTLEDWIEITLYA